MTSANLTGNDYSFVVQGSSADVKIRFNSDATYTDGAAGNNFGQLEHEVLVAPLAVTTTTWSVPDLAKAADEAATTVQPVQALFDKATQMTRFKTTFDAADFEYGDYVSLDGKIGVVVDDAGTKSVDTWDNTPTPAEQAMYSWNDKDYSHGWELLEE